MTNKKTVLTKSKDYISFLEDIKDKIKNARVRAYRSLNKELIRVC